MNRIRTSDGRNWILAHSTLNNSYVCLFTRTDVKLYCDFDLDVEIFLRLLLLVDKRYPQTQLNY